MARPDFPLTLSAFIRRFPDEESCWQYLVASRWPDGWQCPTCGEAKGYLMTDRRVYECARGHQTSATAGTVMHGTHLPLSTWFQAAFLVTTHTPGLSAVQASRQLGVSYETAFQMLHKLRAGFVAPDREPLKGRIQVDETYWGGARSGRRGRGAEGKVVILGAVEVRDRDGEEWAGRLRLLQVRDVRRETLHNFVRVYAKPGATIVTDGLKSYWDIEVHGYRHLIVEGDSSVEVARGLRIIHRVFSNLKTWLLGTHHGAISGKHLQAYLNEFVFRFNRRVTPMATFQTALGIGAGHRGPTYRGIYEGRWTHPNPLQSPVYTR